MQEKEKIKLLEIWQLSKECERPRDSVAKEEEIRIVGGDLEH